MESHRILFPGFARQAKVEVELAPNQKKDLPYFDPWGCGWITAEDGITGSVHSHPLSEWIHFEGYKAPDPSYTDGTYPVNWTTVKKEVIAHREQGELVIGELPHGHTFLRLQDIRGYENLILDMMDSEPRLIQLIGMVKEFNEGYIRRWLTLAPDIMKYPEDLGMQIGPMISPEAFRTYIKPVYRTLMQLARDQGCIVHMHSDGDIRSLADDLIEDGVEVINIQDLVNGIDWIADRFSRKICVELDIDRQRITASGTPEQIESLIHEEVVKLGCRDGGLMMVYGLYPGVPAENIKALMDAMERHAGHFS